MQKQTMRTDRKILKYDLNLWDIQAQIKTKLRYDFLPTILAKIWKLVQLGDGNLVISNKAIYEFSFCLRNVSSRNSLCSYSPNNTKFICKHLNIIYNCQIVVDFWIYR
jgi:hypothetical protein